MKKLIGVVLLIAVAFTLAACGDFSVTDVPSGLSAEETVKLYYQAMSEGNTELMDKIFPAHPAVSKRMRSVSLTYCHDTGSHSDNLPAEYRALCEAPHDVAEVMIVLVMDYWFGYDADGNKKSGVDQSYSCIVYQPAEGANWIIVCEKPYVV